MSYAFGTMLLLKGHEPMALRQPRTEKIDLRLSTEAKATIVAASRATGQSLTDFVLQSALARAEEALPERHHFGLDAERWAEFLAALDAPPRDIPRLRRLLEEPSVFEDSDPR
jgi:uncharacterized protein (DUF1778 family)